MKAEYLATQVVNQTVNFADSDWDQNTVYPPELRKAITKAIKQAQQDAYQDAARIADGFERDNLLCDPYDDGYNWACENISEAIRNKAKENESGRETNKAGDGNR